MISPLAFVDPAAKLGNNVTVHPFAYIDKDVEIGDDCVVMPNASIMEGARLGKNVKVYNGAIVSADPQDFRWKGERSFCLIGDNVVIRRWQSSTGAFMKAVLQNWQQFVYHGRIACGTRYGSMRQLRAWKQCVNFRRRENRKLHGIVDRRESV